MAEKKKISILSPDAFEKETERGVFGAYFFFGEEDGQKYGALEKVREKLMTAEGFEPFNRFVISFSAASSKTHDELLSSLFDALDAVPMMQDKKIIEICDIIPLKLPASELDALAKACKSAGEDTVIFIVCRDGEFECGYRFEQSAAFVKIASAATPVRFAPMTKGRLAAYVKSALARRGVNITDAAAELLCEMCACRTVAIDGELSKISAYAAAEGGIADEAVVREVCAVSTGEETPFLLSDAMQKWNAAAVFYALSKSKDMREEPVAVVAKMGRTYVDMLLIKSAINAGLSSADISKSLKMNAYRVEKYVASLARVPIDVIERAVSELYALDLKLKSTQSDPWTLVDCFAANVYMPKSMR